MNKEELQTLPIWTDSVNVEYNHLTFSIHGGMSGTKRLWIEPKLFSKEMESILIKYVLNIDGNGKNGKHFNFQVVGEKQLIYGKGKSVYEWNPGFRSYAGLNITMKMTVIKVNDEILGDMSKCSEYGLV